jgi:hypothetical protein
MTTAVVEAPIRERLLRALPQLPERPSPEHAFSMWMREEALVPGITHQHMLFCIDGVWTGRVLSQSVDGSLRLSPVVELGKMGALPQGYARVDLVEDVDPRLVRELLA